MGEINRMVAYYRVSDEKQGDGKSSGTGYGMDAQERMVECLRQQHGATVIDSQIEVETGTKKRSRPKLLAALAKCQATGATLVVAKLDRLARNVAFIANLMEAKVPFVCCDNPHATPLVLHIMAAVAEAEANFISSRTKAGLESAKLKGKLLGSARPGHWDGKEHLRGFNDGLKKAAREKSELAESYYAHLLPTLKMMRDNGDSYDQIVAWLNKHNHNTRMNKPFCKSSLHRIMAKYLPDENMLRVEVEEKVPA